MIRTKTWIIIIATIFLVCIAIYAIQQTAVSTGTTAYIYVDGEVVREIDLSLVTESFEFTISDALGENTIRVENGRISVTSADCPDQVCVNQGWLNDSSSFIACLPHHLYIKIDSSSTSDSGIDAVSQ